MIGSVRLTWLGTNSFLVESPRMRFLVDPFVEFEGAENPNSIDDFIGTETIFVTHGHFDHISSIAELLEANPALVLGTDCVIESLEDDDAPTHMLVEIKPGDEFQMGDVRCRVLPGKHIKFDASLIFETLKPSNIRRAKENVSDAIELIRHYPEEGQTVIYDMDIAGRHVQFMGSLALRDDFDYPQNADYLIMPYQGNSDLETAAQQVIERLHPKNIILSHFDDAFPPVSKSVPLDGLKEMMAREFPEVGLRIPKFKEPFEI